MRPDGTPSTKPCGYCGEAKPVDQFYPRKSGGYSSRCIPCDRETSRQWRLANRERARELSHRWALANPDRVRESHRRSPAKTSERVRRWKAANPEAVAAANRRWNTKNLERVRMVQRAWGFVHRAIQRGVLVRSSTCEACGANDRKITAAHHDYARPLDVRWLCHRCHIAWDRQEPKTLP